MSDEFGADMPCRANDQNHWIFAYLYVDLFAFFIDGGPPVCCWHYTEPSGRDESALAPYVAQIAVGIDIGNRALDEDERPSSCCERLVWPVTAAGRRRCRHASPGKTL